MAMAMWPPPVPSDGVDACLDVAWAGESTSNDELEQTFSHSADHGIGAESYIHLLPSDLHQHLGFMVLPDVITPLEVNLVPDSEHGSLDVSGPSATDGSPTGELSSSTVLCGPDHSAEPSNSKCVPRKNLDVSQEMEPTALELAERKNITEVQKLLEIHQAGECKPCMYLNSKNGCNNGNDCRFCHLSHPKKSRPRPCKAKRTQCKQIVSMLGTVFNKDSREFEEACKRLASESSYMRSILSGTLGKSSDTDVHIDCQGWQANQQSGDFNALHNHMEKLTKSANHMEELAWSSRKVNTFATASKLIRNGHPNYVMRPDAMHREAVLPHHPYSPYGDVVDHDDWGFGLFEDPHASH